MKLTHYLNTKKLAQISILALILMPLCSIGHASRLGPSFDHMEASASLRNVRNPNARRAVSKPTAEPTKPLRMEEATKSVTTTNAMATNDGIPMRTEPILDIRPRTMAKDSVAKPLITKPVMYKSEFKPEAFKKPTIRIQKPQTFNRVKHTQNLRTEMIQNQITNRSAPIMKPQLMKIAKVDKSYKNMRQQMRGRTKNKVLTLTTG